MIWRPPPVASASQLAVAAKSGVGNFASHRQKKLRQLALSGLLIEEKKSRVFDKS